LSFASDAPLTIMRSSFHASAFFAVCGDTDDESAVSSAAAIKHYPFHAIPYFDKNFGVHP